MVSLADKAILSGAENRPPMLEKDMYDSWRSRMEMYMLNRQHGIIILKSVKHGPLLWPSVTEEGGYLNFLHPFITPLPSIHSADIHLKGIRPTCDIKTNYLIPNEAAHASLEVEILFDMPVTKNVVERKQDKLDKGLKSNSELFLDKLNPDLTGTIIVMLGRMWDWSYGLLIAAVSSWVKLSLKGVTLKCSVSQADVEDSSR
nr:hypothetical protein [Tanacetum cinerariifolium]